MPKEEDESRRGAHGSRESSPEVESGYLTILQPRVACCRAPPSFYPPTARRAMRDNDDGNGRLLPGGRLCLTTLFRQEGQIPARRPAGGHAELSPLRPASPIPVQRRLRPRLYPHPVRGGGAAPSAAGGRAGSAAGKPARPPQGSGHLELCGFCAPRGADAARTLPGLPTPAPSEHLVAVAEPVLRQDPLPLAAAARHRGAHGAASSVLESGTTTMPAPRRIFSFAPGIPFACTQRSDLSAGGADPLDGRVRASNKTVALMETSVSVTADQGGTFSASWRSMLRWAWTAARPQQHCRLDNAQNNLEEPLPTPCPRLSRGRGGQDSSQSACLPRTAPGSMLASQRVERLSTPMPPRKRRPASPSAASADLAGHAPSSPGRARCRAIRRPAGAKRAGCAVHCDLGLLAQLPPSSGQIALPRTIRRRRTAATPQWCRQAEPTISCRCRAHRASPKSPAST